MNGGIKTSGKSKQMVTHSFLPLLSYAESGAFLIYGTPCIMLSDSLDPHLSKIIIRNSGLMHTSGEHFYDTSPSLRLECEEGGRFSEK